MDLSRRQFLTSVGASGAAASFLSGFDFFQSEVDNPLTHYPYRNWEQIYRDQYRYDSSATWVCAPNDTHNCRLRAFIRNGVIMRSEQNYDGGKITDLYGNSCTANWNPRGCPKGMTFVRRLYGPYRLRYPLVRKMWKQWVDDGFPELTAENLSRYKFDSRGTDAFVRVPWDDVTAYIAKAFVAIARRYSGPEGEKRLREQGYAPEMIEAAHGSGVRCMKFRGGMGLLGVIGKYGMYRFANMMALLDAQIRGVEPKESLAGRLWDNYTWHGDQAPGHPFVHGLQTSDTDFSDCRFTKLHIHAGKNLVENKMADSHWFIESMERGAKIVSIAPEYNPPATKADYWIPIRPATDAALFLGITKILMDNKWYDEKFVKAFTDFPLLVRTDTLKRLTARDLNPNHAHEDLSQSVSFKHYGLTKEQREKIGDYVVWDRKSNAPRPLTREDVGKKLEAKGVDPALEGEYEVDIEGKKVKVIPLWELYKLHLRDYDLDRVCEITHAPKEMVLQLAKDIATIKPVAIHIGEGINHYFHATEVNRATYLPLMLTGNIGRPGAGSYTWAGNYKMANFQGSPWSGAGVMAYLMEDPFNQNLDPKVDGKNIKPKKYSKDEAVAYWNHGDVPLIVETPKGRKVFTGQSHMPTPTKTIWTTNVNLINNAKWAYEMIKNVNPKVEMIVTSDIEMTASCEYSDIVLPANTWVEFEDLEMTSSCSNPFLQIWKGIIPRLYDTKDDTMIMALVARALTRETGDPRYENHWKFTLQGKNSVYVQRILDACSTTRGYKVEEIMAGKYGEPGSATMLFRTYPRQPFYEQIHEDHPFLTATGRMQAYNDEPEVIEYGENFIVHREAPEATPYLPNVIVTTNPYVRPDDYGIPISEMDADARHVRNVKMAWEQVRETKNPLWEKGYKFWCITPKSRHTVHSSWTVTDWNWIWGSNFGDPYRMDKRAPGVSDWQVHMNPQAAKDLGINDGDYVYVDANVADRPYRGARPTDPFYKVARLMLRCKYNPAYPYNAVMIKHASFIATERSVKAHETRPDGRAQSEDTGYQASFRYGSQQSVTRSWLMPMHQTDSLFHKNKANMGFMFGGESDNHAVNTVPKETLVRIVKAEDGGIGGTGMWEPARTGYTPGNESEFMLRYLAGEIVELG
jgi:nitrate reductase alpha subunit